MANTSGNLRRIMAERGISKRELARRTGLSMRTVTRIMGRDDVGSLHTWQAVRAAIGCTMDELTGDADGKR